MLFSGSAKHIYLLPFYSKIARYKRLKYVIDM
jgi:hypothetical protein